MAGNNNAAAVEVGEVANANGDQMVWFTRIRGMLQRGLEFSASPTSWYSQSPTWSLATPTFNAPDAPRLPEQQSRVGATSPGDNAGDQSSTGSLQPEVVQEEVRKAVQYAMQSRDVKVNELQAENAELKQLLMAMTMIEASPNTGGIGGGARPSVDGNRGTPIPMVEGGAYGPTERQPLPERGDPSADPESGNGVLQVPPPPRRVPGGPDGHRGGQVPGFGEVGASAARLEGGDLDGVTGKLDGAILVLLRQEGMVPPSQDQDDTSRAQRLTWAFLPKAYNSFSSSNSRRTRRTRSC